MDPVFVGLKFTHLIAAITWLGGALFLVMVFAPLMRRAEDRPAALAFFKKAVKKFQRVATASLILLVITGFGLHGMRGGHWGVVFGHKAGIAIIIVLLSLWHDFVIGPKALTAMEQDESSEQAMRLRSKARRIGLINLILGIIVVFLAVIVGEVKQ